jgi:hypothetical protein
MELFIGLGLVDLLRIQASLSNTYGDEEIFQKFWKTEMLVGESLKENWFSWIGHMRAVRHLQPAADRRQLCVVHNLPPKVKE